MTSRGSGRSRCIVELGREQKALLVPSNEATFRAVYR